MVEMHNKKYKLKLEERTNSCLNMGSQYSEYTINSLHLAAVPLLQAHTSAYMANVIVQVLDYVFLHGRRSCSVLVQTELLR